MIICHMLFSNAWSETTRTKQEEFGSNVNCSPIMNYVQIDDNAVITYILNGRRILERVCQIATNNNGGENDNDILIKMPDREEINQSIANFSNVLGGAQYSSHRIEKFFDKI